jgi:hypothetical protein
MDTVETRQRQNRVAELQRLILSTDAEIRKSRDKLNALKRAHAPQSGKANKTRLPTEVCQVLCELRDSLKTKMKEVAVLKKNKAKLIGFVDKTAEDEEKNVQKVAEASVQYIATAQFMKYDPSVVAKQRLEHARAELEAIHKVIESQMQHMNRAFDTAARKCELDKEFLMLQQEIQKKKDDLYQINEECNSMNRIYNRKKLCLNRAPKPLEPMEVLQLDMQKEVAYDALSKQETAAVAAKESIAYRANLLCQLERQLKVMSDGIQLYLDMLSANDQSSNASGLSEQLGGEKEKEVPPPVRATTLTALRQKIAALNARDAQLDEQLKQVDGDVSDLEYRVKVMNRATGSLEKERNRLLRQHEKHIGKLQQSMGEQAEMARKLIEEERSRSVSQVV